MSLEIILATEEKTPIYKQLVSQFEEAIRSGKLEPGEQIPSMNELFIDRRLFFCRQYDFQTHLVKV